jgi:hypothetical protein
MWERLKVFWLEMLRLQRGRNPFAFGEAMEAAFGDQAWLKARRERAESKRTGGFLLLFATILIMPILGSREYLLNVIDRAIFGRLKPGPDGFVTVFEASQSIAPWWLSYSIAAAFLIVSGSLLAVCRDTSSPDLLPKWLARIPYRLYQAGFVMALSYGGAVIYAHASAPSVSLLETKPYRVIEGPVRDVRSEPKWEGFGVKDSTFSYWRFVVSEGFDGARSDGKTMHDGDYVRIFYHGGTILRLDVRNPN